uniref:Uncharacterized protein n=1 Tax=Kalanchoe fedtschenkoi TaxID=63787 RepID=A0A7N0T9Z8_KALFE
MASDARSREARRQRIVDRGTDRLALITGRIQTLPDAPLTPTPTPPSSNTPRPQSSQSLHADQLIHPPRQLLLPIPEKNDKVDKLEQPSFTNPDFSSEDAQINKNHAAAAVESLIPDPKPSTQSSENVFSEVAERPQTSSVRSLSRTPQISQPQTWKHMVPFTPKQISSSVSESESLRNFCSFIVASMVVLSYAGFPILRCSLIKKVIFFQPLFLLLLTNITIVAAPLLGEQQQEGTERRARVSDEASAEGPGMAEQLGDVLEIGLLVQKVVGALFMDCSIYSVIVITGLALFH